MIKSRFDKHECPIARALDQVGDWWTLLIVREAMYGTKNFDAFQGSLGIARNILSDRLKRLVENRILEKHKDPEDGRASVYMLTPKGRALWPIIVSLLVWSNRWMDEETELVLELRHAPTGKSVQGMAAIDEDGRVIEMSETHLHPGPGASEELRKRLQRIFGK